MTFAVTPPDVFQMLPRDLRTPHITAFAVTHNDGSDTANQTLRILAQRSNHKHVIFLAGLACQSY